MLLSRRWTCIFSQNDECCPVLTDSLRWSFNTQLWSSLTLSLQINLISYEMNHDVFFFFSMTQLIQSFVSPVPAFLRCIAGITFKWANIFQKPIKFFNLIWYVVFILFSIEYRFEMICKSLHCVFIYNLRNVQALLMFSDVCTCKCKMMVNDVQKYMKIILF